MRLNSESQINYGSIHRSVNNPREETDISGSRCGYTAAVPEWLKTSEIAAAAQVSEPTILRWARFGLLPKPTLVYGGARGRSHRWPPEAADRARWVLSRLEAGYTIAEIRALLEAPDGP